MYSIRPTFELSGGDAGQAPLPAQNIASKARIPGGGKATVRLSKLLGSI